MGCNVGKLEWLVNQTESAMATWKETEHLGRERENGRLKVMFLKFRIRQLTFCIIGKKCVRKKNFTKMKNFVQKLFRAIFENRKVGTLFHVFHCPKTDQRGAKSGVCNTEVRFRDNEIPRIHS